MILDPYPHFHCNLHGHNGYLQLEIPTQHGRIRFAVEIEHNQNGGYRVYWSAPNDIPCRDDIYIIGEE